MDVRSCTICGAETVGVFLLDRGCVCSSDTVQGLCLQHAHESEPLGSFEQLAEWEDD